MNDILTFKVKKPHYHKQNAKRNSKAGNLDRNLVYITRIISRGDFDPEKSYHVVLAKIARSKGIIDKDNNILKEEYLICKTKR